MSQKTKEEKLAALESFKNTYLKDNKAKHSLLAIALIVIGIIFISQTLWSFSRIHNLYQNGASSEGTVIQVKEELEGRQNNKRYYPIVTFKDGEDQSHQFENANAVNPDRYAVGSKVKIFYDPKNPDNAVIEQPRRFPLPPIILSLVAIILGAVILRHQKKKK